MTTTTRTIKGIVSTRTPNDPAKHSPHVDPARPGDDRHQSEYDQKQYLKAHGREKDGLMKQFCKLEGPSGNSAAFQRGWDAVFGAPEVKARALAEIEMEKMIGEAEERLAFAEKAMVREASERLYAPRAASSTYRDILNDGVRALVELREDQARAAGVMDAEGRIRLDP